MGEKKSKAEKTNGKVEKSSGKSKSKTKDKDGVKKHRSKAAAVKTLSLLADDKIVDPTLSTLFAAKPTPPVRVTRTAPTALDTTNGDGELDDESSLDGADDSDDSDDSEAGQSGGISLRDSGLQQKTTRKDDGKRKRKRKDDEDNLEDVYLQRLEREELKDAGLRAAERASKRQKGTAESQAEEEEQEEAKDRADAGSDKESDGDAPEASSDDGDDDVNSPPPRHETEVAADAELAKANRTVFLGNVSTSAITSKSARKTLLTHLQSFFGALQAPKAGEAKHAIESYRFRSTPYASAGPKKAAFVKKEVMDATTKSTNAYIVYSSQVLAREAAKRLNGTVVLDRHLRADEVAHPARTDSRRCVFVGNLGFVDDETNIQKANEEEGKEKRKPAKQPADIEEGLWRTFSKCGTVESVRVIRDSQTRISKGVAYVQFHDENAVESALLYEGKKFPPMLPRKLRVTRARAAKRNAKPGSGRPSVTSSASGYQRKVTGAEASQMGRAGKLFGRAGAAQMKQTGRKGMPAGAVLKAPESFIFEGHRARPGSGKAGLRLGGAKKGKKVGKPTSRSARRGAAFKSSGGKKDKS